MQNLGSPIDPQGRKITVDPLGRKITVDPQERKITVDPQGRKRAVAPCNSPCPIERGMRVLGGKWKGSILWHLKDGPVRFNDLARQLEGASKKMVSQRLRDMETMGLVHRQVLAEKPVAVTYTITDFGRTALGFLQTLRDWSEEHGL